jgi:cobalt-precorrin 5A hydrolase / precorrin-3B C17-methyltransferase
MSVFEQGLKKVCQDYQIDWHAIAGLATIDLKRREPGLLGFSLAQNWPLTYFTQTELALHAVPNSSAVVNAAVGVSSVCEAAALRAATQSRVETAAAVLVISKQIFQESSGSGAITIAIAAHPSFAPAFILQ